MAVSFTSLDLNLLRVFDAVMEERSVLRASQKVFLSQSAVSHSLARLRDMLDDELFVRTATGMQPTARALALASPIREALRSLEAAIEQPSFDPATSTKKFTLAASDFITMVVVPRMLELLRREAPLIDIVIRPGTRIDLAEQLDLGRIDLAVGTFSGVPQRFQSSLLFEYDDVLIMSSPHQRRKCSPHEESRISLDDLSRLSIAVVSLGGEQDGAVDGFISERGLARRSEMYDRTAFERALSASSQVPRIAVSMPHFLALPSILEDTELAAIVPRPLAESFANTHAISIHELPYPTTRLEVRQLWHERHDGDASQSWLHEAVRRATSQFRVASVE